MLISAVQHSDSVIHIYTFFFIFFSIMVYPRILNIVPCATSRTLLFIHSMCNSLHLLTPNSQSIPPPHPSPLATTSLFSMSVSLTLYSAFKNWRQNAFEQVMHSPIFTSYAYITYWPFCDWGCSASPLFYIQYINYNKNNRGFWVYFYLVLLKAIITRDPWHNFGSLGSLCFLVRLFLYGPIHLRRS